MYSAYSINHFFENVMNPLCTSNSFVFSKSYKDILYSWNLALIDLVYNFSHSRYQILSDFWILDKRSIIFFRLVTPQLSCMILSLIVSFFLLKLSFNLINNFRKLGCGNHLCEDLCHPGDCGTCSLMPDQITHCRCGQTPLEQLQVPSRTSCLDPVPTCEKICNKPLMCGPEGEKLCLLKKLRT